MKRIFRFYKNENGWFISLKWFPLNVGYLAMVLGADVLLDKLVGDNSEIKLIISTRPFEQFDDKLTRVNKLGLKEGAVYEPNKNKISHQLFKENQLWLCPVTLFVFLRYPKNILL